MTTYIRAGNELPREHVLKRWARILALVGLGAEILCAALLVVIGAFTQLTLPLIIKPLFGIFLGVLALVLGTAIEKIMQLDEQEKEGETFTTIQGPVSGASSHGTSTGVKLLAPPPQQPILFNNPRPSGTKELSSEPAPPDPQTVEHYSPLQVLNRPNILPDTLRQDQLPFIVPLEGNNRDECDDKADSKGNRYVVTDGVAQSFMPAQWAKLIARHFVERTGDFTSLEDFTTWLSTCSDEWDLWVRRVKLPVLEKEYAWMSWEERVQQGAQTTLVGCSLSKTEEGTIVVRVTAIGDAYFFLYRRTPPNREYGEQWVEIYPPESPDGENVPNTLKTVAAIMDDRADARIQRSWASINHTSTFHARPGDVILLVSDKLALWIWEQMRQNRDWTRLLTIPNEQEFREFVLKERAARRLAADDTTLFLIALNEQLYQALPYER